MRRPLHNAPPPGHPVIDALGSPQAMLTGVLDKLDALAVDVSSFEADHICFRCATVDEYRVLRHTQHMCPSSTATLMQNFDPSVLSLDRTCHPYIISYPILSHAISRYRACSWFARSRASITFLYHYHNTHTHYAFSCAFVSISLCVPCWHRTGSCS